MDFITRGERPISFPATVETWIREPAFIKILMLKFQRLNILDQRAGEVENGNGSFVICFIVFDLETKG